MEIKEAIEEGVSVLKKYNIQEPRRKIIMLLTSLLGKEKSYLLIHEEDSLSIREEIEYKKGLEKLMNHIPICYITHKREFMGLEFFINSDVLIPQPDTEILVEEVLTLSNGKECPEILDMCTGSGCIGLSLAYYQKKAKVTLSDISKKALEVAKQNAKRLQLEKQTEFVLSDLYHNLEKQKKFDIIVSNPPYIESEVIRTLEEEVQKEPVLALDGGRDGLDFYKKIIKNASDYLKKEGLLCLEIGYNQKEAVISLIEQTNQFSERYVKKDLAGLDRVIIAKRG